LSDGEAQRRKKRIFEDISRRWSKKKKKEGKVGNHIWGYSKGGEVWRGPPIGLGGKGKGQMLAL